MEYTGRIIKAGNEEAKKTGKLVFKVTIQSDGKDWEFTLFDTELIDVAIANNGGNVKYTVEKKGDFWNLVSLEPASEEAVVALRVDNGDRQERIEAQVAYKIIARLWCADKLDEYDALVNALLDWLCVKMDISVAPKVVKTVPERVSPTGETVLKSEKPEVNMSPVNSFGELYTRAKDTFNMSRPDVWKALDVKSQMEISDFNTAWQTIVSKKS